MRSKGLVKDLVYEEPFGFEYYTSYTRRLRLKIFSQLLKLQATKIVCVKNIFCIDRYKFFNYILDFAISVYCQ